jgi:hypothetical protein
MNIWARFQQISGKKELRIGEVTEHLTGGLSKLTDLYGQEFIAIGQTVGIGDKAYVEDGKVVGQAPSLSEYEEWV